MVDMKRHLTRLQREIIVSSLGVMAAITMSVVAYYQRPSNFWSAGADKVAIALLVALAVRWINMLLESATPKADLYASSLGQMMQDLGEARRRIWIAQNWLPNGEKLGYTLAKSTVPRDELRLIVASLRRDATADGIVSPVYARIRGRKKLTIDDAKTNIKLSVQSFAEPECLSCVRFNYGHSPGWIVVIDDTVYWGPTPIHEANWDNDLYFHRADVRSDWGTFWKEQFIKMWDETTHNIEAERAWNEKLVEAVPAALERGA